MPIITVQFIKDVVATPEQKRELVIRLTDTFVDILGDVVRPFVYCLIQETPVGEWAIAGVPMPDLAYLTSPKHAAVIERSNEMMRQVIAQQQQTNGAQAAGQANSSQPTAQAAAGQSNGSQPAAQAAAGQTDAHHAKDSQADQIWRGETSPQPTRPLTNAEQAMMADALWRGEILDYGESSRVATEHRRLFERWFEELWNRKNYDIPFELVHPDFTAHGAGGQDIKQGPNGVIGMVKAWHAAMPDGRMTMDDIVTEGDLSTIRMTWRGTHTGAFGNIPASGNPIEVTSIGIDRVVDGKITEGWGELNMLGMLQQMGAIPAPQ